MEPYKLFEAEHKFVHLIWEHEPINSTELVKLSHDKLGWKKSTTYTVLRKLCERGILRNEDALVSAIVKKADAQQYESQTMIKKTFDGSLPQFLTAFLKENKLTEKEAAELKRIIEEAAE
ncbi:MAG: BlaI/MecI/CopY family transcriptional regulator [Gorillibacterium sp.]|nr:BlaI/MecI/CopY family transcriptional regulator [Gorillibacterium sp.]